MRGKLIELYLVNGTADSIITAELSNWNGKAIKIPRIEVIDCKRDDIQLPGVYFLFCRDEETDTESVYIGEAENVKERLDQHIRDASEKDKYYWNTAVAFVGRDLNKALIRYLENKLVEIAKDCKRFEILTKKTFQNTVIKESQVDAMEEFLDNIKILINALGYKVLTPIRIKTTESNANENNILFLKTANTDASGEITSEGFVLLTGSKISEQKNEKSLSKGMMKIRLKHFEARHINSDLVTTEDILFSSSSAAASFVTGYSVSGPAAWKNKEGISLKDIESEKQKDSKL